MDDISKMLNEAGASGTGDPVGALGGLGQAIQGAGGIDGIVDKLRAGGLGGAVDSWVSTGPNQPVAPEALGQALGPDTVRQLSSGSGIDIGQLLPMLAAFLPQIVNMLTPNGSVPSGGLNGAAGGMPDLGGLLGGLTGGTGSGSSDIGTVLGGLLGGKGR
jgi:uncharacterized protein YidB (DUF937 family)